MRTKKVKNLDAQNLGKLGGGKTLARHGADYFKKISKLGVAARKKK